MNESLLMIIEFECERETAVSCVLCGIKINTFSIVYRSEIEIYLEQKQ
jgi:hypothetical protein